MRDDLTALTTPRRVADDRFAIDVPDGWQQGRGAFGGLVVAYLIRAGEAAAGAPDRPLRSLTAEICGPVLVGPAELRVEILRAGSGTTTLAVRLLQENAVQAHAVLIFGKARATDFPWPSSAVPVGAWTDVPVAPVGPPHGPVFAQHVEYRVESGLPFSGHKSARCAGWVRIKNPGPARDAAFLAACIDAWWPSVMAQMTVPRPAATIAFSFQIAGSLDGLDLDAPFRYEADSPALHEGYLVEMRSLRGHDGRLVALNQQTFAIIR